MRDKTNAAILNIRSIFRKFAFYVIDSIITCADGAWRNIMSAQGVNFWRMPIYLYEIRAHPPLLPDFISI